MATASKPASPMVRFIISLFLAGSPDDFLDDLRFRAVEDDGHEQFELIAAVANDRLGSARQRKIEFHSALDHKGSVFLGFDGRSGPGPKKQVGRGLRGLER